MMLFGGVWKTLGLWMRKVIECSKWNLMGYPYRSFEDIVLGAVWTVARPKRLQRNNISSEDREHCCDALAKNVDAFSICPKSLPESKLKTLGLIPS